MALTFLREARPRKLGGMRREAPAFDVAKV